jgi:hypothetical protein
MAASLRPSSTLSTSCIKISWRGRPGWHQREGLSAHNFPC